jgi:hypothetical protein
MNRQTIGWLAVLVTLVTTGSLPAHHSLAKFDLTKAVHVKGTILEFHLMNPHSFIYLEQKDADGQTRKWAAEGPSVSQFNRSGLTRDFFKAGTVIEICGYVPKEALMWQIANSESGAVSPAGRLINAELLVTPDGKQQSWGDYGVHKCFADGYKDQHSK